ncbi:MAG TPA: hypothetical protein VJR49_01795 [Chthoniobacterales bacterium]|nr:hypothetical protein [Chthoniobacterales bacterium]
MESAFADLAQALRERLAIIRDEESRRDQAKHIERLRVISEEIERLQASLPPTTDPQLKHYLQRKSYDKALQFLENSQQY